MVTRIAIVLGCGLGLAACGSSGPSSTGAASAKRGLGVAYSECMRSHGLPSFPDPGANGGIRIGANSGVNPASPAFQSAQKVCSKLIPGGGPGSGPPNPQAKAHLLALASCMRSHGVSDFPDPRSGSPPSDPTGYSGIIATNGYYLAIPSSINVRSPAFLQASTACSFGPRGGVAGAPKGS